jgi:hypothetical protein
MSSFKVVFNVGSDEEEVSDKVVHPLSAEFTARMLKKYPLVSGEDATNDKCGKFSGCALCTNVALHEEIGRRLGLGDAYKNKVFSHKVHFSCNNPRCMVCCRYGWAVGKARDDSARLDEGSKLYGEVLHWFVSISPDDYDIENEKVLRKIMWKAEKFLGVVGAINYFHGSRHRTFEHVGGGVFRQMGTDWKPHYHGVGYIPNYSDKCGNCDHRGACVAGCGGFNDVRWQYYKDTGVYVGVKPKRKTVFGTCWYLLHHCSVERDVKRFHSATLFGAISYRRMKFKAPKHKLICKICEYEIKGMYNYVGKKPLVFDRNASGYVRDSVEDWLDENGVCNWVLRPKRSFTRSSEGDEPRYGSMEWLKIHGHGYARDGFQNEGGSYGED